MADRFAIVSDGRVSHTARDVDGFFVDAAPGRRAFRLLGAEQPGEHRLPHAELRVLDDAGAAIGAYRLTDVELGQAAVTATVLARTHALAGQIWDRWRPGPLTERNGWAGYPTEGRAAWLEVARMRASRVAQDPVELDGTHVTDRTGLFCALGEAANGPGGYFGANLDALADCLRGGFGATPPFELVWHASTVARQHVAGLEKVLGVLEEADVRVVFR